MKLEFQTENTFIMSVRGHPRQYGLRRLIAEGCQRVGEKKGACGSCARAESRLAGSSSVDLNDAGTDKQSTRCRGEEEGNNDDKEDKQERKNKRR